MGESDIDDACEALSTLGYAVLEGGYTPAELTEMSRRSISPVSDEDAGGQYVLRKIDEHSTIRVAFHRDRRLRSLATNQRVLDMLRHAISDYVVPFQQNGIINPAHAAEYTHGA